MSETVTRADLVSAILSADIGVSNEQAKTAVDAVFDGIAVGLKRGHKVRINGFGTFETKGLPARTGRNPRTGEEIAVAASIRPLFKAHTTLKDYVNGR